MTDQRPVPGRTGCPAPTGCAGSCHCGAETEAEDPVEMWEWLLAHPDHPAGGTVPAAGRSRRRRRTSSPIPR